MNVAQRATSSTGLGASAGYFTVDRFNFAVNATAGRVTATQDSSAPSGFANSTKIDVTTADTSISAGEYFIFQQKIEGQNLQGFAKGTSDAKPFAVSFYVKGNASATYCCELFDGDNSRQASKLFSVTTDWTRVELTFDADTTGAFDDDNASSFELNIWLHGGSNFTSGTLNQTFASNTNANRAAGISSIFDSTDRTFFITGVQIEVGQNPTTFEHETFERTLAKCQRYTRIFKSDESSNTYSRIGIGVMQTSTTGLAQVRLSPRMRATPSASTTGQLQAYNGVNLANCNAGMDSASHPQLAEIIISSTSGFSAEDAVELITDNASGVIFELSSEL